MAVWQPRSELSANWNAASRHKQEVTVDISAISAKIEALRDEKIEGVAITAPIIEGDEAAGRVDLSAIDFEQLAKLFATRPKTAAEQLRSEIETKAQDMAAENPTRVHLVEKLEKLVEAYNFGTVNIEAFSRP
jgi:type I restriction enzyme R subunit